ncbi:thiosulfate sulfurtransferase 18 [Phtheirospermum japonicum]|uniref:Thiosulfate sulfurtransferase 18 n=1 Tax=Phtheirospermum japonicum TaxID=374723 RepID=A0A830DCQ7_9LAMI|nr:thiosulfate sulfurtransferase 18 [Phtheirospermum japonicum]
MFNTPEGRVKNPKFLDQVLAVCKKEDNLVVGCQSGVRSVYATIDLVDAEFKNVRNMGGGYSAWVGNAFEVTKPNP